MTGKKHSSNIETDAFDRELFTDFLSTSRELTDLVERGANLLPGFPALVQDIFAAFYKYNVLLIPTESVEGGSPLGRRLVEKMLTSGEYEALREETVLTPFASALATVTMGRRLLSWLRSGDGPGSKTLLQEWETAGEEEKLGELQDEAETWDEVADEGVAGELEDAFTEGRDKSGRERRRQESVVKELREGQAKKLLDLDMKLGKLVDSSLTEASERVEGTEEELLSWGTGLGQSIDKPAGERLDLAERLHGSEKLRRLSLLVGALKEEMLTARRKSWSRRGDEVYELGQGDDLGYLVPSELTALRHPTLRRDFLKRYVEKRLLQYHLKEDKGRGPFVVCLDTSASMSGEKDLWAKAVCLTLVELAKRQKRQFSIVVFSSSSADMRVFSAEAKRGHGLTEAQVLELASYFPGGGTDFETPLTEALGILSDSDYKGGDLLFITDGECDVREDWLVDFKERKSALGFSVFSVLIDLRGAESTASLERFSDKVTTISNLRESDTKKIFLELG